jgi:SAM-dependent methyltransferase
MANKSKQQDISVGNYESFARKYAQKVDNKPIHVYYERPNTWSLLPEQLTGLNILDLGCGSGWYAEELLKKGVYVTAVDISETMVELTKQRLKNQGRFLVADLEKPLDQFKNNEFDIILAPLVVHYIKEWGPLFKEISRILVENGLFIFSTHQPQTEFHLFNLKNYYEKILINDYWHDIQSAVSYYHHTLHELSSSLYKSNLSIELLEEPMPLPELQSYDQETYLNLTTLPWFLFVKARKISMR